MDVAFINFRGLGGAKLLTPKLYTSFSYLDVQEAVDYLQKKYPTKDLYAIGVSMGGNVLANMIGF